MFRKMICVLLAATLCVSMNAYAANADITVDSSVASLHHTTYYVDSRGKTRSQRDADFQAYLQSVTDAVGSVNGARGNLGYSYSEVGDPYQKNVPGYPGNQPTYGYSFGPLGGTVYFTETGGPSAEVSFTTNLTDYFSVSVSIPLGNMTSTTTGHACNIPGSPDSDPVYYKVFEYKTVEITPYVVYWRQTTLDPWVVADTGEYVETLGVRSIPIEQSF